MAKFVFGPVPSRRLGFSLGVDIIPRKYCNFDCIYCQVGKTANKEVTRKAFFEIDEVVKEVIEELHRAERTDFVTFSGSGEPTLNLNIRSMIHEIKQRVDTPVAVITNGSLLSLEEVRNDINEADVVLPSLDAASEDIFRLINRPHSLIQVATIIEGLKRFRESYQGLIWLEIMMIKGVNDDRDEVRKLKDIVIRLGVDKIHLNTVTRPPSEITAGRMKGHDLEKLRAFFGDKCEVISSFKERGVREEKSKWTETLVGILRRRSLTVNDIAKITGISLPRIEEELRDMEAEGRIEAHFFGDDVYYSAID
ncbi:MAG: molybdenum cofactor biosynthesis protein A [Syntrophorhabdus sp. PtaU1.Bin050]|nr:MAG: molybdenum cofactor biosynthesis protein A [Syntrophorhabdus sp. PtaU1.Bin050]